MFMNTISMSQTRLYNISYQRIFTTISHYRGHLAIVQHNTNFATVHSQVTVGGCSVKYECKLLRQCTTMVGATEPEQLNVSLLTLLHTECRIPLFYLLVGHRFRVTQRAFKKKNFFWSAKLLGTHFVSIQ